MKSYRKLTDFAEDKLIAFAAGESVPIVEQFVAEHPEEWKHWQQEERVLDALQSRLYRHTCPSSDQLRDYYWQDLPAVELAQIRQHLAQCQSCQQEFALFEKFMVLDDAPLQPNVEKSLERISLSQQVHSVMGTVRLFVATLISPPADLAYVAFRKEGSEPTYGDTQSVVLFEAGDVTVSLAIQQTRQGLARITGQVFTALSYNLAKYELLSLQRISAKSVGSLAESGTFEIEEIQAGEYQLTFFIDDLTVLVPALAIQ